MQYTRLPGIDKPLSRLVYGAARPTLQSPEEAYDCLENAFAHGFRVFDTANSYGKSEENLGYWLEKSGRRKDVVLFDKGFNPNQHYGAPLDVFSGDTIRAQVALSLERLRTDHVEFYVLHRDDPAFDPAEIIDALNEQKALGRICRFGVSNWTMERIIAANTYAAQHGLEGFSLSGPCYSLANLATDPWGGSVTISGPQNKAFRAWLQGSEMPVFPYSSLARGFMSGKYRTTDPTPIEDVLPRGTCMEYNVPANIETLRRAEKVAADRGCAVSTVALAWLLSRPMNIFPIVSPTGDRHLQDAVDALHLELTEEELNFLRNEDAEE